jgi:hypothetical protein
MPDDWAKKFVENYNQEQMGKQQKEQEAQARRRLAEDGAREKFHNIRERVKQDIQILRGAVAFQSVELQEFPEDKFTVISRGDLRVELNANLSVTTIVCEYTFSPKEAGRARKEPKTLRICSDLDGRITVAENGEGKTFVYDSEVSEFLLKPLLNHINSQ